MAKKVVKKTNDRKERLAALREKLASTDYGGGHQGFWQPKEGKTTFRILPETGDMDFFYQAVGKHFLPNKTKVYCPRFTSEEELECPICELQRELWNAGDEASKNLAKQLRVRKQFWMNVVVREKDQTVGPLIFTPGILVFEQLVSMVSDPDYGDIFDPDDGLDLTITRTGKGLETKYDLLAKRNPSPLMDTDEEIDRVLDEAKDLSWIEVSADPEEDKELSEGHAVFVLPYERLVAELGLDAGIDVIAASANGQSAEDNNDDDDEPQEENEVTQELNRRRSRRSR